jgi:hypothetical protein
MVGYARRVFIRPGAIATGAIWREDVTVAADPDPYFAFPKLSGAPAYARPPRVVEESPRPFDPDDLPIAAEQTDEERAFTSTLQESVSPLHRQASAGSHAHGLATTTADDGRKGPVRRLNLRAVIGRREGSSE